MTTIRLTDLLQASHTIPTPQADDDEQAAVFTKRDMRELTTLLGLRTLAPEDIITEIRRHIRSLEFQRDHGPQVRRIAASNAISGTGDSEQELDDLYERTREWARRRTGR